MDNQSSNAKVWTKKLYSLPNGWKFSVVRNEFSYGSGQGLFEVGMWQDVDKGETVDCRVDGWLTAEDVIDLLAEAYVSPLSVYVNKLS